MFYILNGAICHKLLFILIQFIVKCVSYPFLFLAKAAYNSAAYDTRQNAYAQQAYPTQPQYAPYQVSVNINFKLILSLQWCD